MSEGPRIPLARAQAAAAYLIDLWALEGAHVVGSVRRGRSEVGDLELIAPAADAKDDRAHARISATMFRDVTSAGLFEPPPPENAIGRAIRGLNPGFLAASLEVRMRDGTQLPVQVYRYTKQNFGWTMLMRTGPADFGRWFLSKWKDQHHIPHELPASASGNLVDIEGRVVPTATEDEAFARCGLKPVAPEHRDEFIGRIRAGAAR